jgi:16S rRNA G527 N7-methylase RsmG
MKIPIKPIIEEKNVQESIKTYLEILLEYNRKVNLISRKITPDKLNQLLKETFLLNSYIASHINIIVDAGSGNGILGIPLALMKTNENKKIILVEPQKKKFLFLLKAKKELKLPNIEVKDVGIEEYLKSVRAQREVRSLIARGFPRLNIFYRFLEKEMIAEAVLITSENKIKKNRLHLESINQKTYNIPLRKNLKILKMEKTGREKE